MTLTNTTLFEEELQTLPVEARRIPLSNLVAYDPLGTLRTSLAWECNCEEGYIHSANEERCFQCGAQRDECASANVLDAVMICNGLPKIIRDIVEAATDEVTPA